MKGEPFLQICIGQLYPRTRSIMGLNLPIPSLCSNWPAKNFRQCPKTSLDTADHGGEQSDGFVVSELNGREKHQRQDSIMQRKWNHIFLQPDRQEADKKSFP